MRWTTPSRTRRTTGSSTRNARPAVLLDSRAVTVALTAAMGGVLPLVRLRLDPDLAGMIAKSRATNLAL